MCSIASGLHMKDKASYPLVSEMALGQRLKAWRDFRRLTQADVERIGGLAHNALSRIETGLVSPKLATLERIAAALELSGEELHLKMPPSGPGIVGKRAGVQRLVQLIEGFPPEKR